MEKKNSPCINCYKAKYNFGVVVCSITEEPIKMECPFVFISEEQHRIFAIKILQKIKFLKENEIQPDIFEVEKFLKDIYKIINVVI